MASSLDYWVITGASRGIGLELAKLALQSGHQVAALVRDPQGSPDLAALMQKHGDQLKVIKTDVQAPSDLQAAAARLHEQGWNRVDVLINNAGTYVDGEHGLETLTPELLQQSFAVNSIAPLCATQAFLKLLAESPAARVANVSSLMGSIADNEGGGSYAYRMSKAALNMLTKTLSRDYAKIISISLHPGWVKTRMGGGNAPTEVAESGAGLMKVIMGATAKVSGHFFDFEGEELPW